MIAKGMGDYMTPQDLGGPTNYVDSSLAIVTCLGLIAGTYLLYKSIGGRKTK